MNIFRRAYDSMKEDFKGTPSSDNNSHYRSNYEPPLQSWQDEEKWNALPEAEQAALQEKRDAYLAEQRIKNDPLGIAKEMLEDAMNPDEPAGDAPQDRIRAADETINDYDRVTSLLLKATHQGQIEGVTNTDPGSRRVNEAVSDLYNPKIYEALGMTREEFIAPLEQAYLARAEANIALASEMPANKTPEEAYDYRREALNSAERSYDDAARLKQIEDKGALGHNPRVYKNAVLEEQGISQGYLDGIRNQITQDKNTQLRQQGNLDGQKEDAQVGYLSPEARGVPRPPGG